MTPARGSRADSPAARLLKQVLLIAGALAVLAFTIEGGEFGTSDVVLQKQRKARLQAEVEALRMEVESLKAEVKTVNTDNARLERIAREQFGMVKGDKEILYWTARRSGVPSSGAPSGSGAQDTLESSPRG